jgi:hypothetical protein
MEENNTPTPQVFDSPEELVASMETDSSPSEPQEFSQESSDDYGSDTPSQPTESTPYVDPEAAPSYSEPTPSRFDAEVEYREEPQRYEQPQYSPQDLDNQVLNYMSKKLNRQINSFEDFNQPQINESVDAINRFVQETGRTPQDWFRYQTLNPEAMDDLTAVKVAAAAGYQNLSPQEIDLLVSDNYKLDAEKYGEESARVAALRLKIDAEQARNEIQEIRNQYAAPIPNQSNDEPLFDQQWINNMANEFSAVEGLEFDLGDGSSMTFGLNDQYRQSMTERGARLDEFFDPFFREDGSFDYDGLATQMAVLDNIDTIVRAAYNKGRGDGQRGLVSKAANVGSVQPNSGSMNESNPLGEQVRNIMSRSSDKLTFNI